jgi:hypothetical protein
VAGRGDARTDARAEAANVRERRATIERERRLEARVRRPRAREGGGAASTREAILKCALPAPGEVPSVVADVSVVSN